MHRKEREIRDRNTLATLIRLCRVCRIGLFDGSAPYVVPVNFYYSEGTESVGKVYFHSAVQGKKLDCLRAGGRVAVEWDISGGLIPAEKPCDFGFEYASVIAAGVPFFVDSDEDKARILTALTSRYLEAREEGDHQSGVRISVPPRAARGTVVVGIGLDEISGKASSEDFLAEVLAEATTGPAGTVRRSPRL
jgi:hypothetical protein